MRRRAVAAAAAIAFFSAAPAEAHLVTTGLGPAYDGVAHFLESPDDWAAAVAMAFLAGQRGTAASRRALFSLPVAWFAGGLAGIFRLHPVAPPSAAAAVSLLVTGTLVAAGPRLGAGAVTALAALLGFVHGTMNGLFLASARGPVAEIAGIAATVFVAVALSAALVVAAARAFPWTRVAVRVAGSWIAAIGLLLLGWQLRAPG